jgi:membrane dipeptidase
MELVEEHARLRSDRLLVARTSSELQRALEDGRLAIVHCVDGGYLLGATVQEVDANVARLSRLGVAYVTLAGTFWRGVATNAPAVPGLSDRLYHLVYPQPRVGLTELARAAVRAMVRDRVLVDVARMSERALNDAFDLLDELDPYLRVPVIASHAAYRFGRLEVNLTESAIRRIAARGGVIGLTLSERYLADGLPAPKDPQNPAAILAPHIDRIREITGSYDNIALGSDLDGPRELSIINHAGEYDRLHKALEERYGLAVAEQICLSNALSVLRTGWRRA